MLGIVTTFCPLLWSVSVTFSYFNLFIEITGSNEIQLGKNIDWMSTVYKFVVFVSFGKSTYDAF